MHGFTRRKKLFAAVGVIALFAVTGVAFAYWTGTGTGSAGGTVSSGSGVTLSGTIGAGSAPGTSVPVTFTAANAGTSAVTVSTVTLVSISVDGPHGACNISDFSMAPVLENHAVPPSATVEPMPNNGSLVYANNIDVDQGTCKGALLTLHLSA